MILWTDGRDLAHDLYVKRITASGTTAPGWPEDGLFIATDESELGLPRAIPDGTGGAIIVWEDDGDFRDTQTNIYAQRIAGDGTIPPGWPEHPLPICTALRDQRYVQIVTDGAGGAIISWVDLRDNELNSYENPDIYALRLTAFGTVAPGWQPGGTPICTHESFQYWPTLASDLANGAIISWTDSRDLEPNGADIYAQRVTPFGDRASGWPEHGAAISTEPYHQSISLTVSDGSGGAVLIWQDSRIDTNGDVWAQRITSDGIPAPGWPPDGVPLCRAPRYQQALSAASDGAGGAIVAWEDYRCQVSGGRCSIHVQRITADGAIPSGWPANGVPLSNTGFGIVPQLASDGSQGAYVVWEDSRPAPDGSAIWKAYSQHVTASGQFGAGWDAGGRPLALEPGGQFYPTVAPDLLGGAIAVWMEHRNGQSDIYAQKLIDETPVGTRIPALTAQFSESGVELLFVSNDLAALFTQVQRRTSTGRWETIGLPIIESEDRLHYLDRTIRAGESYWYRLSCSDGDTEWFTEELRVDIPIPTLALAGFRPNPSRGSPQVAFTLRSDEDASLELVSVSGRVLASLQVGSLGPGSHVVDLGRQSLRPGVYLLRLSQGGETLSSKAVISN